MRTRQAQITIEQVRCKRDEANRRAQRNLQAYDRAVAENNHALIRFYSDGFDKATNDFIAWGEVLRALENL